LPLEDQTDVTIYYVDMVGVAHAAEEAGLEEVVDVAGTVEVQRLRRWESMVPLDAMLMEGADCDSDVEGAGDGVLDEGEWPAEEKWMRSAASSPNSAVEDGLEELKPVTYRPDELLALRAPTVPMPWSCVKDMATAQALLWRTLGFGE